MLIPQSNVQHLMLRKDVIEACAAGRFAIYPVATIDEGIALLTGRAAGQRGADGNFEPGDDQSSGRRPAARVSPMSVASFGGERAAVNPAS